LCHVTKGVPDAINEAQVITISLAVVVAVCAIGFGLTLGGDLDHRDQELTICVCFFLGGLGTMVFYFGMNAYLLLTGADLNAQSKIVRKGKTALTEAEKVKMKAEGTKLVLETSDGSLLFPKTIEKTENGYEHYKGISLTLLISRRINLIVQVEAVRVGSQGGNDNSRKDKESKGMENTSVSIGIVKIHTSGLPSERNNESRSSVASINEDYRR
jgi:hypothetical protein